MLIFTYSFWYTLIGIGISPLFGILMLHGSGNELDLYRYLVPILVGGISGFMIGNRSDKANVYLKKLYYEIKAHKNSQKHYDLLFQKSRSIILLIAQDSGQIIKANPAAAHFYGYSVDMFTGMKLSKIAVLPAKEIKKQLEAITNKNRKRSQLRHKLSSGEMRNVEVESTLIVIDKQILVLSVVHDLTESNHLRGLLPFCSQCNKYRNDSEYKTKAQRYIENHPEDDFSSAICPECFKKMSQEKESS